MNLIADWFTYLVYSALWRVIRWLPEKSAYGIFELGAKYAYRRDGKRVRRLRENYRRVRPTLSSDDLEILVRAGLSNAMRYWCDTFRISDWTQEDAKRTVTSSNEEILHSAMSRGKGVIIAVPHAGNWDHAGYYYCSIGYQVHTVAEHLKPERLFRKFLSHRERMGMIVLDLDGQTIPHLVEFLQGGKLVALVSDRDLSKSGQEVEFFGGTAKMPVGPALLAYKTGADLITAYVGYRDSGINISWQGPVGVDKDKDQGVEVARVTQAIAEIFQGEIDRDPTSWHMQQRIFIDEKRSEIA
jgi:lauroyl/myristoyl acyltransferase